MSETKNEFTIIYCCVCEKYIVARLSSGKEIYPHRKDLYNLPFWVCDSCKNYVGTHRGTTNPLGVIPSKEIRQLRQKIHLLLDPLWKMGKIKRSVLYKEISERIGKEYHTAHIKSIEEGNNIINIIKEIMNEENEKRFWKV